MKLYTATLGAIAGGCLVLAASCAEGRPASYPVEGLTCSDILDGATVSRRAEVAYCVAPDGTELQTIYSTWECEDGRTLWTNQFGWGYLGEESHPPDPFGVPVDALSDCLPSVNFDQLSDDFDPLPGEQLSHDF